MSERMTVEPSSGWPRHHQVGRGWLSVAAFLDHEQVPFGKGSACSIDRWQFFLYQLVALLLLLSCSVVSDSVWPHGLQPTRLPCPWDSPGKSTGVGCPCLLWKRSLVFPILLFSSNSSHWSLRKAFLSLLAIPWNSALKWVYLSFSPLLFNSLLLTAICKIMLMEKKCKKAKWRSGEALQIAVKRREAKSKGVKERYKHECRFPKNSKKR